jgi:beta-lactamase superfamily II metal-dependent hydrolase
MNEIFNNIPLPSLEIQSEYDCGDGAYLLIFDNATAEDFENYCSSISCKGFTLYSENIIDGNIFRTYYNNVCLHTYFCPNESKIRVIADPQKPCYLVKPNYTGKNKSTLWQFEVDHSLIDCGMCYIIRCDDGSFFVIDSAHYYSVNDDKRIVDFLKKLNGEEKPRVTGWFISHGHEDHIGKFTDILKYRSDEISIESVYLNIQPLVHKDSEYWDKPCKNGIKRMFETLKEHKEIKVIKLHSGQHFCVRNLEFDVLCTHEDIWPNTNKDFNDASTVIIMSAEGSKVLFPGDAAIESDKIMLTRYNSALKCDVIQVSHHGHTGTSPEFYRRAGAECALFPTTQIKYDEEWDKKEANRVAVQIAKESYIASNGTVEIPLPYNYGNTKIYPDETFEDFNGIFNLWTYEYTDERKTQLYNEFLKRNKSE